MRSLCKTTDLNKSKSFIKCRTNYTNHNFCYSLFDGFWHRAGKHCQQFSSTFLSAILIYFHFIRAIREFDIPLSRKKKSKLDLLQNRGKVWVSWALHMAPFEMREAGDTSSPQKLHLHIKGWNSPTKGETPSLLDLRFTHQHFRALDWGNDIHTGIFQWMKNVEIKSQLYFLYGSCNYCWHMQTIQNKPILLACNW